MTANTKNKPSYELEATSWQEGFLQMLPLIEKQARVTFRDLDAEAREDAVAEVVANAMVAYRRLHERGELQRAFASALTRFAVAQYKDGRRTGTSQNSRDVFSQKAKRKAGYEMLSLGAPGENVGEWTECLIDQKRTPIPDQVAFRMDVPRWLNTQTPRNAKIAERLAMGYSIRDVAREFKVSQARISQLRRELAESWFAFIEAALQEGGNEAEGDG